MVGTNNKGTLLAFLQHPYFVGGLILVVVLARLILALLTEFQLVNDPEAYHQYAIWIAQGKGYLDIPTGQPTAYWPVGYPAFLGAIYFLFGANPLAGEMANALLSGLVLWLAYDITRQLFDRELTGRCLLLLLAFYPPHWQYSLELGSEMLALTLVLLVIALALRPGVVMLMACGLAAGAAFLVKPQTVAVAGIAWLFTKGIDRFYSCKDWGRLVGIYTILVLMVLPWSIRNQQVFDEWVIVSTNGGINLFIGNNPQAEGGYHEVPELHELLSIRDEVVRDREARKRVSAYFEQDPLSFLKLIPNKLSALYDSDYQGSFAGEKTFSKAWWSVFIKEICNIYYYALLLSGLFGFFVLVRKQGLHLLTGREAIPIACVLWFTSVYMMFFGISRFHFLMMPFVSMYGAYWMARFFVKKEDRATR